MVLSDEQDNASVSTNCVSWHPKDPSVIASAHDNLKIKIWSKDSIKKF